MRLSLLTMTLVVSFFHVGCAAKQRTCATTGACGENSLCVNGICRPKNETPTPARSHRLVLEPSALALVSSQHPARWTSAEIPFGRQSAGEVVLLLRFPSPFGETSRIRSAVLVLEPTPTALAGSQPVQLSLSRILSPWSPTDASWARLPTLSPAELQVPASTWGNRLLYVDVTAQVRRWRQQRSDEHGIALVSGPQDPVGASYATGLAGGRGPRLDVYLQ